MSQTKLKPNRSKNASSSAAPAELSEVLTLTEAAAYLRTSPEEVFRLVHEQGLPGRRVGDDCRFLKSAIQDWLRSLGVSTAQAFWHTHFGALKDDPHLEEMLQT